MFESGLALLQPENQLAEEQAEKFEALQAERVKIATRNPQYLGALMRVGALGETPRKERPKRFGIP